MSRVYRVRLSDAMVIAARKEAIKQGRADGNTDGVPSLLRGSLRAHLNRNGFTAEELDIPDGYIPPAGRKTESGAVAGATGRRDTSTVSERGEYLCS
jgi:hypothetical protein